jgi:hypothetical protein
MAWSFRGRSKKTKVLKKLKKYKGKDEKTVSFRKYRIGLAIFCLGVGWMWSFANDRGATVMGQVMMLVAGIYIALDVHYLLSPDPVDEIIGDLEQQFWDSEFRKDSDPMQD